MNSYMLIEPMQCKVDNMRFTLAESKRSKHHIGVVVLLVQNFIEKSVV